MTSQPVEATRRPDPRRQRTRNALISGAQRLLATGRTAASIQEITDEAGVGFGSFFNHFDSKEELFQAAVDTALQTFDEGLAQVVADIKDPAEVFAMSFRLTGRLQRVVPEFAKVVLQAGTSVLDQEEGGLVASVRRHVEAGRAAGKFDVPNPDLAVMAVGGVMLSLLQLLDKNPDADAGDLSDQMTFHVLRMLGMTKTAARELCAKPLPALPPI